MNEKSASRQIDDIIAMHQDWHGRMLSKLRTIIQSANQAITEEVKWKKPSKPEGVPVWVYGESFCVGDVLKNAVRLTFTKGAQLPDPKGLFNSRLDSKTVRAIDFGESDIVDEASLTALIHEALNITEAKENKQ